MYIYIYLSIYIYCVCVLFGCFLGICVGISGIFGYFGVSKARTRVEWLRYLHTNCSSFG